MKSIFIALFATSLLGCVSTSDFNDVTSNITHTDTFNAILDVPRNESTLFVFDIDDTLLTAPVFYGSDYWYNWLKTVDKNDANYVQCKWEIIPILYELTTQTVPADAGISPLDVFNSIAGNKLILTSRSPDYRPATTRELHYNHYQLPEPLSTETDNSYFSLIKPGNTRIAPASYKDGILMTTGFDKGLALYELLETSDLDYQTIVMIDDGEDNIHNVAREAKNHHDNFYGYIYTAVKKPLPLNADSEEVKSAAQSHKILLQTLKTVYPDRYKRLEQGCGYDK